MDSNITSDPRYEVALPPWFSYEVVSEFNGYIALLFLGTLFCTLAKLVNISYQIPAIILGILIGVLGVFTNSIFTLETSDSSLLLSIYVPTLIAKLTYSMDNYLLLKSLSQIILITIVGNLMFIPSFALLLKIVEDDEMSNLHLLMITIIFTPSESPDMPNLDGIKNLATLMCGESVFNLVICFASFRICEGINNIIVAKWYQVLCIFLRYILLGLGCGYLSGQIVAIAFREMYADSYNAVCTIFSAAYFIYNFCEHVLYCSGSLASFIALYCLTLERTKLLTKTDNDIKFCIQIAYTYMHVSFILLYVLYIVRAIIPVFNVYYLVESVAIYIVGNVLRLIVFLLLSPILSRIGYGFDFTGLVSIFWAVQKGPLQYMWVISELQKKIFDEKLSMTLFCYCLTFVSCSMMINGTTLKLFLKRFGLIKLSARRKANVCIGINTMNETGGRVIAMLKINQFYSDANWAVIYDAVELKNPFQDFTMEQSVLARENINCNKCHAIIALEPSEEEYNEHLKEVTLRVLKAQRVSFVKQHDMGFLTKIDVKYLLQAVEIAMDSTDLNINLDNLFTCIDDTSSVVIMKKIMYLLRTSSASAIPKSGLRRKCYFIAHSLYFEIGLRILTLINVIIVIARIVQMYATELVAYILLAMDSVCVIIFIAEIVIIFLSYGHMTRKQSFAKYMKNHWNKVDFIIVVSSVLEIFTSIMVIENAIHHSFRHNIKWARILLISIKLLKVISRMYPNIVAYLERKKDIRLMRAFAVAMAIVVSCEDVIYILPTLTEQTNVNEHIKANLLKTRSEITQKLGVLEKERPSLTTTIKTAQALRCIIKVLRDGILDLKTTGLIDPFEFNRLNMSLNIRQHFLDTMKILEVIQPTSIFYEVPWLCTDQRLLNYIYKNVKTKIFNAGDVLCNKGDIPDGVYIIVAGYFQVIYYPSPDQIEKLRENGELPTKEFLEYMRFGEIHEDYLSCGNRMGELAVLTNRPYSCSIISKAPSQAFIIPRNILRKAMKLSPDPVLGLGPKIWKCVLLGLGRRILLATTNYQGASAEHVDYAINRAIVPDINYFNVISITHAVEDVLLLEGIVVDYNTREVFIAPCAIPRYVNKLIMPRSSLISVRNIKTKLMFIPISNMNEYDMMQTIEENSELIPEHNETTLDIRRKRGNAFNTKSNLYTGKRYGDRVSFFSTDILGSASNQGTGSGNTKSKNGQSTQ